MHYLLEQKWTLENQPMRRLWHWYLVYRTFEEWHFHRCTLIHVEFFVIHTVVLILCCHFRKTEPVILVWNPGSYHRIFFMFTSQLNPHYKEFQVNKWSIIAFSTETSGAIRRTTVDPPVSPGIVPPHPPVGADGNDPIHPDDYGPPQDDDIDMSHEDAGSASRPPFPHTSSVDATSCWSASSTATTVFESWRNNRTSYATCCWWRIKLRRSSDHRARKNTDKIETCITWFRREATNGEGKGSNKETEITLARTSRRRNQVQMIRRFLCLQRRHIRLLRHSRKMMNLTKHHSQARILFHIRMLRRKSRSLRRMKLSTFNRMDHTKLNLMIRNSVNFGEDYLVLLGHKSTAPDFKSLYVDGFRQFCEYLAKNGKKTPKAEAVITPEVLQKYAKQIKQAKLAEFRSFLDFSGYGFQLADRRLTDRKGFFEATTMKKCLLTLLGTDIAKHQLKQVTIESRRL